MTENSNTVKGKLTPKNSDMHHAADVQAQRPQQPGESRGSLQRTARKKHSTLAGAQSGVSSPGAFLDAVRKLQAEVSALRRQPGLAAAHAGQLETIEKRLAEAIGEAQKPKPDAAVLGNILGNARLLLTRLSAALPEATAASKQAARLARLAKKMFLG